MFLMKLLDHLWPLDYAESEFSLFCRRCDKRLEKCLKTKIMLGMFYFYLSNMSIKCYSI